jgi:hypothetical protein
MVRNDGSERNIKESATMEARLRTQAQPRVSRPRLPVAIRRRDVSRRSDAILDPTKDGIVSTRVDR